MMSWKNYAMRWILKLLEVKMMMYIDYCEKKIEESDFEEYRRKKNEDFLKCYEHITDPVERVKELFKHTQEEAFMGGELMECKMITEDLIGVASERRMDANMMCSLNLLLNGHIVFGSLTNDTLVIKIKGGV